MVGNLTKKIKNVKCPGVSRGGMETLGFDSYIMHSTSLLCPPPYVTKVCFATCIIINTCPFFTNILFENVEKTLNGQKNLLHDLCNILIMVVC